MNINRSKLVAALPVVIIAAVFLGCAGAGVNSPPPPPATVAPAVITLDEFNQIQPGMTYEQVQSIVGAPGEITSEMATPGFASTSYKFDGGLMASAIVSFNDGKVASKTQFGLK